MALLAPSTRPGSVVIGILYFASAIVILPAPRGSASFAALATAIFTTLLAWIVPANGGPPQFVGELFAVDW